MKEELSKKAIVIIYPDGYIDAIDINDKDNLHNDYYDSISKYSVKLTECCNELILNMEDHYNTDNELVKNGCVVILNWDIRSKLKKGMLAELYFMLPNVYGSIEQATITKDIINSYPDYKRHLNVYDETIKRCKSAFEEDVLNIINKQIEEMKEGKKNGKF